VNYYDPSLECDEESSKISEVFSNGMFVMFFVLWVVIGPYIVVCRGRWEYFIDYTSLVTKISLLLIAKKNVQMT
jgi:hypothetical protein